MKRTATVFCALFFACPIVAVAQEFLSVRDAVAIALENNYAIKLSENDLRAAKENATRGNAGMLPTLTANLAQSNSVLVRQREEQQPELWPEPWLDDL